jgi:hypothetical protein
MPAEVMSLRFLYRPVKKLPAIYKYKSNKPATKVEVLPFRYNAIHDIESVWWVGVWMMFLHKPGGYNEPEDKSLDRQRETSLVFPGTLTSDRRLLYVKDAPSFREFTENWISEEFLPAVEAFDIVRAMLRDFYQEIEETFPDGLSKLSATADRRNTREAFPGGPKEDIYGPIQDTFLEAKVGYDNENTKLERFKVSKKDGNNLKTGKQMSRRISGKRRADDGVAEEGEGKGKRTRRLGRR